MRVATRIFKDKKILVLISESEDESKAVDSVLGDGLFDDDGTGPKVAGNVCLADGYGEHYIRLERVE